MLKMHINDILLGLSKDAMPNDEKRAELTAEIMARTGIDEQKIDGLVRKFYSRVRQDPLIGPIFDARIQDWEPHLRRMCGFWSAVALHGGGYHGRPMEMHRNMPVDGRHFDRWLLLFSETAEEVCSPAAAAHFIERARNIAQSLEPGLRPIAVRH